MGLVVPLLLWLLLLGWLVSGLLLILSGLLSLFEVLTFGAASGLVAALLVALGLV